MRTATRVESWSLEAVGQAKMAGSSSWWPALETSLAEGPIHGFLGTGSSSSFANSGTTWVPPQPQPFSLSTSLTFPGRPSYPLPPTSTNPLGQSNWTSWTKLFLKLNKYLWKYLSPKSCLIVDYAYLPTINNAFPFIASPEDVFYT